MKNRHYFYLIIVLSLIPLFSLLKPGMYWAHDSQSHLVRVASFYQSLAEGNIFPRWSHALNAGYGHPIFMFLYPLPSYLASAFHSLSFNFATSIKLVLASTYVGTGIFMYLWLKKHFTPQAAFIGAAVFQFAPYRFVNLYVRNAFGEHVAFMFIPLTLLSLHFLITKPSRSKIALTALSLASLILAHNAVSLMFIPFLGIYSLLLIYQKKKNTGPATHFTLYALILGLSLATFFWLPAFAEGKYTLREIVMQADTFKEHFPTLKQLIVPNWGYDNSYSGIDDDLSFQIGIIQWLSFLAGATLLFTKKTLSAQKYIALLALFTFIASTVLLQKISLPLWQFITILKKFQFPWRLLILPVFASSILAALAISNFKKIKSSTLAILITIGLLIQNYNYLKPRGDYLPPESQVIQDYLGTTDTGESTPLWAIRFQEKLADNILGVVHGAPITYDIHTRKSELHEQTITTTTPTQVSENTLYFPGWTVYIDGQKTTITFDDVSWRGVITYLVPQGTHNVKVIFEETKLRKTANTITIISLVIVLLLISLPKLKSSSAQKN